VYTVLSLPLRPHAARSRPRAEAPVLQNRAPAARARTIFWAQRVV